MDGIVRHVDPSLMNILKNLYIYLPGNCTFSDDLTISL